MQIPKYSASNLRASKTVNGVKTNFVWNGQNLASETKNDVTTSYTYDPTGVILSKADNVPTVRFVKDPHGNVVATSKNNQIMGIYDYTAFGTLRESTEDISNPFRYCGEYYDEELDSVYLRNRYYQPSTGRFLTEDPIRSGSNWYIYAANNPVRYIDPSGLIITCTMTDSEETLRMLRELTDDDLYFDEYLDDDGNGTGMGEIKISKSYDTERHVGQTLVTDLINSDTDVNINLGFDADGNTNHISWDDLSKMTIWLDNGNTSGMGALMMDTDTGDIAWTAFDDFMVLGHEMVHAWRGIKGLYLPDMAEDGSYRYGMARQEELQTTGLFYNAPGHTDPQSMHGIVSENGLRLEYHKRNGNSKMKLRLQY